MARSKYMSDRVARSGGGDVGVDTFVAMANSMFIIPSHGLRTAWGPSFRSFLYVARNDSSWIQGTMRLTVMKYSRRRYSALFGRGTAKGSTVLLCVPSATLSCESVGLLRNALDTSSNSSTGTSAAESKTRWSSGLTGFPTARTITFRNARFDEAPSSPLEDRSYHLHRGIAVTREGIERVYRNTHARLLRL